MQKFHGRVLLEAEAVANRITRVNQQPHPQRQSGFALKRLNSNRRLALVEQPYVFLLQILDEVAMLVGRGEDQIDQIDFHSDAEHACLVRRLPRLLLVPSWAATYTGGNSEAGSPDFGAADFAATCRCLAGAGLLRGILGG